MILLILSIYFFLSIYFSFFIFIKKIIIIKTISIVECEALGVKSSEHFFERSPNDLAALLIGSINLTRIKFEGNRHIYE